MRKLPIPISPSHLHKLLHLRRTFSTIPINPLTPTHHFSPSFPKPLKPFFFPNPHFQFPSPRFFSSTSQTPNPDENPISKLLSLELSKNPDSESLPLPSRLTLSFSHIPITPPLLLSTLNISPEAGREALHFLKWAISRPDFYPSDQLYAHFVDYFGRRKDFKATHLLLLDARGVAGVKSFECLVDRLVRAGRPTQVVSLFDRMVEDYGFERNLESLRVIVNSLCDRGFASYAEKMVKGLASEFFPDDGICEALVRGWCVDGKLEEVRRLVDEMGRGGFEIGTGGYNEILDCVCRLCREKDPYRLKCEAESVLLEMERKGVPRDVETFNVLISNLCKVRMTEDAMILFGRMGEWGCYPNETTFLVLIRSLYQAARVGEGDEMIDRMKSAGYGDALDKKAYYEFLKILCGIERIDHAMSVFGKMKEDGCEPGMKTYDLLMGKWCSRGRLDKANVLYKEAESNGLPVEQKQYLVDPRFVKKKPTVEKKVKKRETLPEKMARKRTRLRKIRLSYVKKPKKSMRRAY